MPCNTAAALIRQACSLAAQLPVQPAHKSPASARTASVTQRLFLFKHLLFSGFPSTHQLTHLMDPVSAGSAVLAFVVLALRSAQAVHTVLSEVRDGPHSLRHLVGEVAQLQSVLERLANLPPQYINQGDANLAVLQLAADRCREDMESIDRKLQRLNIRPTDRRVGKLWKLGMTAISEKELVQMQRFVHGHVMMLGLQLSLLQMSRMSASQSQLSEMKDSLRQLTEQMSAFRHNPNSTTAITHPTQPSPQILDADSTGDAPEVPEIDPELEKSLVRLVECIGGKESTVESHDAQQMIDDLEALLRAAEREESKVEDQSPGQCGQEQNLSGELKVIRRLIGAAPTLAVNGTGTGVVHPHCVVPH